MDIKKDYEFEIGDKVITTEGEIGRIVNICRCDRCAERGFYEPIWRRDYDGWEDYITIADIEIGFTGFYQIGKYHFRDFDKEEVMREMAYYEEELKRLRNQLKVMEEYEV
jgi:hypothetical protein